MSTSRNRSAPGACYFVTTKCAPSRTVFQIPETAKLWIDTLCHCRAQRAYLLHEFVLLPDHFDAMHETTSLEKGLQLVKGGSSHEINKNRRQKMKIWQQGFHEWVIRDAEDWRHKAPCIATNPVRAHLVSNFRDWPYSSASGKFVITAMPARFSSLSSEAEAPVFGAATLGLKSLLPRESR
jgi:REP-associated tyrosine transposase